MLVLLNLLFPTLLILLHVSPQVQGKGIRKRQSLHLLCFYLLFVFFVLFISLVYLFLNLQFLVIVVFSFIDSVYPVSLLFPVSLALVTVFGVSCFVTSYCSYRSLLPCFKFYFPFSLLLSPAMSCFPHLAPIPLITLLCVYNLSVFPLLFASVFIPSVFPC